MMIIIHQLPPQPLPLPPKPNPIIIPPFFMLSLVTYYMVCQLGIVGAKAYGITSSKIAKILNFTVIMFRLEGGYCLLPNFAYIKGGLLRMKIKNSLDRIKDIVRGFKTKDIDERLLSYTVIITILGQIEEVIKDNTFPNYKIYKRDLLGSCEVLCGLDDGDGRPEGEHIGRAFLAVDQLKSVQCFNVDNHHI